MFSRLATVFGIPELRQKIFLTLILLAVYRLGYNLPLPFVDQARVQEITQKGAQDTFNQLLQVMSVLSAAGMDALTVFGLGIMPYISASIIFQLLGHVYPPLERLQKEGESGRKKINEYTRYATVPICVLQSIFWLKSYADSHLIEDFSSWYFVVGIVTMTSGTMLLMWIGEQIDEYGVGNGISLLIMAGILARMPEAFKELLAPAFQNGTINVKLGTDAGIDKLLLLSSLFVAVIVGVVAITQAQRRIPIQSAKHVKGSKVVGGQRHFLPLRLNQSGVMPIIFASSLLMIPGLLFSVGYRVFQVEWFNTASGAFIHDRGFIFNFFYIILIYFFCYFWMGITFNPKEIAENLKDYGSFVPGYRPGARTAEYLDQVMNRVTYVGAGFLAAIAIIPTIVASALNIPLLAASFYGGTGLLIVVSVAIDLVQKIDSHLVMRNKGGLLESEENI